MIDFSKRGLYDRERKKLNMFKENILVKESERDSYSEFEDDSSDINRMDATTVVDSEYDLDGFGGGGFGGFDDDFSFGGDPFSDAFGGDDRKDGISERGDMSHYQTHMVSSNELINFLVSPVFLIWYVILHITRNNMKVKEWENELRMVNKVNIIVIFTAVLFLLLEGRTIISPWVQLISGILMFAGSTVLLKVLKGEFKKKDKEESEEERSEDLGDFGFNSSGDNDLFGGDSLGFDDSPDFFSKDSTFEDDISGFDDGENDFFEETPMGDEVGFPKSPLVVSDDDAFDKSLTRVYKENERYLGQGASYQDRKSMLYSFAPYMATNYKKFGEWKVINETSISYINIAFTLFLALEKINNRIGKAENVTDDFGNTSKKYSKMYVNDIKENTMMYRIEIELPEYFTEKRLTSARTEFYNMLKASENDTDVNFLIATIGGGYVIKLFKKSKDIISFGDMLRYNDPTSDVDSPLDQFLDDGKGLPVLLGLKNNEFPVVVDYEDNTSGAIVGGSGSGKSWATFYFLSNFLTSNDYHNLQMVVFDKKNAPFWNQYALTPHVIGYHHQTDKLLDICNEVYAEIERRKELLNEVGAENFKGYRKTLRKKGKYDEMKRFPLLLFVVDEITSTMNELYEMDEKQETYKSVRNVMAKITQEGRSLGVRMLVIGQRAIDTSIPKNVIANASFKFGMKLDNTNDFNSFDMENDVKKLGLPTKVGEGILRSMGEETAFIKTLGVGGTSDEQILRLIRALSLEWNRRSVGDEFVHETTNVFKVAYNRDKFREKALGYLERGELLPATPDKSLEVNVNQQVEVNDLEEEETEEEVSYEEEPTTTITRGFDDALFSDEEEEEDSEFSFSDIEVIEDDKFEIPNFEEEEDVEEFTDSFSGIDFDSIGEGIDDSEEFEFSKDTEEEWEFEEVENTETDDNENKSILDSYDFEDYEDEDLIDDEDIEVELEEDIIQGDEVESIEQGFGDFDVKQLTEVEESKESEEDYEVYEDDEEDKEELRDFVKELGEVEESEPIKDEAFYIDYDNIGAVSLADEEFNSFEDMDFKDLEETSNDLFDDISNDIVISTPKIDKPKEEVEEDVKPEIKTEPQQESIQKPKPKPKTKKPVNDKPKMKKVRKSQQSKQRQQTNTKVGSQTKNHEEVNQTQQTRKPTRSAVKGGVMFDPGNSGVGEVKTNKKSNKAEVARLKRYMLENGENSLTKSKVLKSKLRDNFNGEVIGDALDSGVILSYDEDYFVTRI